MKLPDMDANKNGTSDASAVTGSAIPENGLSNPVTGSQNPEFRPLQEATPPSGQANDHRNPAANQARTGFRLRAASEKNLMPPDPKETNADYAWADRIGTWKARWGVNRMQYVVSPGLYRLGSPNPDSPVLVTSNYKMSFDMLRRELHDRHLWILVLDTKGINVWCAAGKGTFGTSEAVRRIRSTGLSDIVRHRIIILPQLGAPGVSAHELRRQSGFRVVYGPVRASDVPAFLDAGMKATVEMRRVHFTTMDRLVLTPIELTASLKPTLWLFGAFFLLNALGLAHFGAFEAVAWVAAIFAGSFLTPLLLPWIPGSAFSFKGVLAGLVSVLGTAAAFGFDPSRADFLSNGSMPGWMAVVSASLAMLAVSSFTAMNFTGCTPYTSPSGVLREMKMAVPLQAIALVLGSVGILAAQFIR
jgi:hypothetical protein